MIQQNSLSVDDNIYAPLPAFTTLTKELKAITGVKQSSSNELSTPVSDRVKRKQTKVDKKCVIFRSWRMSQKWLSGKLSA